MGLIFIVTLPKTQTFGGLTQNNEDIMRKPISVLAQREFHASFASTDNNYDDHI